MSSHNFPILVAERPEPEKLSGPSEDLQMGEYLTREFDGPRSLRQAGANKLTDDALLDIFDFYVNDNDANAFQDVHRWHTLVHVCRRWRDLVFASPRRLNLRLQLLGKKRRPVKAMLDIWPTLSIEIKGYWIRARGVRLDNTIAALEHPNRVCSIELRYFPSSVGELLAAAMQVPFPELTHLDLRSSSSRDRTALPDSFLGGSAPRLRTLQLMGISFPALPNLLLSASDLVELSVWDLPHSGYTSPASMVACLSSLNRLKSLSFGFQSPLSRPDQPSPPPQTRVVLPALTKLTFVGMTDYSEDFLARIDTPVLDKFSMLFSLDLIDIPHFKLFIDRATGLKPPKAAMMLLDPSGIRLELDRPHGSMLTIWSQRVDWQVDSMARVCRQLSPFISLIERLDLVWEYSPLGSQAEDGIASAQFLELFRPFTAVRSLHVSGSLVPFVATALQGPRATEVLLYLRDLFLGSTIPGTIPEVMRQFVDARQLSGHPIVIHHWEG